MELSKKIYGKQFTTVTTHRKVQSYYNEKCAKYLMFDLKRFTGVIFHGDAKFEEKLTCGLEHDKEYRKFSPEQFKVSKLG